MPVKVNSKEVGLEIGLLLARFFLDSEDLHFGYWPEGSKTGFLTFPEAQSRHSDLIFKNIPDNVDSILDVGAGSGELAKKLSAKGFKVDCVSPSSFLSDSIESKLTAESKLFRTTLENLDTENRYDLILFSESFQYVKLEKGIEQCVRLLNKDGYLLICDFFQLGKNEPSPLRGGKKLDRFFETIGKFPFHQVKDLDITRETAPTIEILDNFLTKFLKPTTTLSGKYLFSNYPLIYRMIKWKMHRRLDKIKRVYLSNKITGESFIKHKSYRLFLYKTESV
ncbi:MAG: hypothetical protein CMG75_10795 [Candidatus Marinimicrobia bacterium]|nr:hypothetical protein [Candidatus Neomarinimicrobiota bacterium]|tara:strand:+ start:396 stop:1235 length:840 start_codon:yes stop_codon:yes gene_type:complete